MTREARRDRLMFLVGVPAVALAIGVQWHRGELGGLGERSVLRGPSGDNCGTSSGGCRVNAAMPLAIRKDARALRSPSPRRIEGIGLAGWHTRAVRNRRQINRLRRIILTDGNVTEALNLAATVYGYDLWSKARCETGGTFDPHARNLSSGASGLLQFLPSTWRSTPFGRFSVWSPYANALAAGWMHRAGRGNEWSCP